MVDAPSHWAAFDERMNDMFAKLRTFQSAASLLSGMTTHPATRSHPGLAITQAILWQLWKRTTKTPVVIDVFSGAKLICYPDSRSASAVLYYGLPDYDEMSFLRSLLRPNDVFYDVGANVGVYSLLASASTGGAATVVAFEPDATNFARLVENFRLNALPIEHACNMALGDEAGTLAYANAQDVLGRIAAHTALEESEENTTLVPVETLDAVALEHGAPDIIKIDVEGYELNVLMGARSFLEPQSIRVMLLETNSTCDYYGTSRDQLMEFLRSYGYNLYELSRTGQRLTLLPISPGDYPNNAVALADPAWLQERMPALTILGPAS